MKFISDDSSPDLEINVTPLIDVVFILLLFFMLTTSFISDRSIDIKLPKAKSSSSNNSPQNIKLKLSKGGDIYLDGKSISLKKLRSQLKKSVTTSEELSLTLEADKNLSHGKVVEVMDVAREVGILKIGIATDRS